MGRADGARSGESTWVCPHARFLRGSTSKVQAVMRTTIKKFKRTQKKSKRKSQIEQEFCCFMLRVVMYRK